MLEYEKKVMLSKEEYFALMSNLRDDASSYVQTNYYFDTEDLKMNDKGITCRVRCKDGKYTATIKNHLIQNYCSSEDSFEVDDIFEGETFKKMNLQYQGCLVTTRTVVQKDDFCEVVLDRNDYLGHTDYELEIEHTYAFGKYVFRLLEGAAESLVASGLIKNHDELIKRVENSKSKSQRFLEAKKNQRRETQ